MAVEKALENYRSWFKELKDIPELPASERFYFIGSLPYMGPRTTFHLARNIGFDCAKPDVHVQSLARRFGYYDVQTFCGKIAHKVNERIGVVDVVLWRYCQLHPGVSRSGQLVT